MYDDRMTLASLRIRSGYTQEAVARLVGISRQTIAHYELNSSVVPALRLRRLADLYKFPLEKIYIGDSFAFCDELKHSG